MLVGPRFILCLSSPGWESQQNFFLKALWWISYQARSNTAFVEVRTQEAAHRLVGEEVVLGIRTNQALNDCLVREKKNIEYFVKLFLSNVTQYLMCIQITQESYDTVGIHQVWGKAENSSFLICSQLMLLLWAPRPHCNKILRYKNSKEIKQ